MYHLLQCSNSTALPLSDYLDLAFTQCLSPSYLSAEVTTDLFWFISRNKILVSVNIVQTKVWHGKGCHFSIGSRRTSVLPSLAASPASISGSCRKDSKGYEGGMGHIPAPWQGELKLEARHRARLPFEPRVSAETPDLI